MLEKEETYDDESVRIGRGMLFGTFFGILLWAGIIYLVVMMFR